MKCTIESLHMNVRYRILHIKGESYILDMGGASLWKVFFPFLYWFLPVSVYKIDDSQAINAIASPDTEQQGVGPQVAIATALSLVLGNIIYPLIDYLNIKITATSSAIIVFFIFYLF